MLSSSSKPRDPRLARGNASALQEMRERTTLPLKVLRWGRRHASERTSTIFLFISNLNDNVTESILKSELSQCDTIQNLKIPTIDGRSAGIASVLLPSKFDAQRFVSHFDGFSMFGMKLSVEPDLDARKFRNALKLKQNPMKPSNHESTPPTKDTRADSNSPNWSLASQSEQEEIPYSPNRRVAAPHSSVGEDVRKTYRSHSRKRPRPRFEGEDLGHNVGLKRPSLAEEHSHRHSANATPNCYTAASFPRSFNDEQRSTHFSQSRRQLQSRNPPGPSFSREHTCSSRSWASPSIARGRNADQEVFSTRYRHHRYSSYADEPHRKSRRENWLPRRRSENQYRDHRPYDASRTYNASSGRKSRPLPFRSSDKSDRDYSSENLDLSPRDYPAIVLRGVPSDIFLNDISASFKEFHAIHVQKKYTPGPVSVLFSCMEDRDIALRYGCFIFSGVRITPELCLTRFDRHSISKKYTTPSSAPRTESDGGHVSPYRYSRHSEDRKRVETPESGKLRQLETVVDRQRQNRISSSSDVVKTSSMLTLPNCGEAIPRYVDERVRTRLRHSPESLAPNQNMGSECVRSAECDMKGGRKIQSSSTARTAIGHKSVTLTKTPSLGDTVKPPLMPQGLSGVKKGVVGSDPHAVKEKEHSISKNHCSENQFETEDDLFDAVLRHTIDRVSKQHAQLETRRYEALVARSVFDFVSTKKAEKNNLQQSAIKTDSIHRVPRSAKAFSAPKYDFQTKDSPKKRKIPVFDGERFMKDEGSARKRLRKSRFSDALCNTGTSLLKSKKKLSEPRSETKRGAAVTLDSLSKVRQRIHNVLEKKVPPVLLNESEVAIPTVVKSSQKTGDISKSKEAATIIEEIPNARNRAKSVSLYSEENKDSKHSLDDNDPANSDLESSEKEIVPKSPLETNNASSLSVQPFEQEPPLKTRSSVIELDKVIESKTTHRHSKSSLLMSLHTESGLPSLGLFSRQLPSETIPPSTSTPEAPLDLIDSGLLPLPGHNKQQRRSKAITRSGHTVPSKGVKANVPTKKQSRKNTKPNKIKRERKSRRGTGLQPRKTKSNTPIAACLPNGDQSELYISDGAGQGTEISRKEAAKSGEVLSKDGLKPLAVENAKSNTENDVGRMETNKDEREGKCARTEIYIRGQNKNKRRKRLHLESISVKSTLSSRQCRQEKRLYRKGVSKIKPKNDNFINLNSLQQRWKKVQFDRSQIHGMGLYAKENIEPDEFVIEYIGDLIRRTVADLREKEYTRQGMGDSYLFRLNSYTVIDATRRGGIARFINHSCDPNVIARKITVDGRSTIAFYSKRAISIGEELTYDYKFDYEAEDKKIPCMCGAATCRKYLN
ncbi:unnamed protein product [Agarophyton chilense]|eukprot:gb/GEZJ01004764.1/.p1 GENE.gb/GEZJ01004764.1/~~gb/GEZJ01004764.1/.p1  ORF type:complete len:1343 (-),score=212.16 gb/GEZJ01004764.1/:541-4569(-)